VKGRNTMGESRRISFDGGTRIALINEARARVIQCPYCGELMRNNKGAPIYHSDAEVTEMNGQSVFCDCGNIFVIRYTVDN
jgi:hypothetical protein